MNILTPILAGPSGGSIYQPGDVLTLDQYKIKYGSLFTSGPGVLDANNKLTGGTSYGATQSFINWNNGRMVALSGTGLTIVDVAKSQVIYSTTSYKSSSQQSLVYDDNAIYLLYNGNLTKLDWNGNLIKSVTNSGNRLYIGDNYLFTSDTSYVCYFDKSLVSVRKVNSGGAICGVLGNNPCVMRMTSSSSEMSNYLANYWLEIYNTSGILVFSKLMLAEHWVAGYHSSIDSITYTYLLDHFKDCVMVREVNTITSGSYGEEETYTNCYIHFWFDPVYNSSDPTKSTITSRSVTSTYVYAAKDTSVLHYNSQNTGSNVTVWDIINSTQTNVTSAYLPPTSEYWKILPTTQDGTICILTTDTLQQWVGAQIGIEII